MTRSRRLLVMLIAAMLIMAIPGTAFAAKKSKGGKYVPTSGVLYNLEDGKWVEAKETLAAVFDKSGKVRSVQYKGENWSKTTTYAWKGENLRSYSYARTGTSYSYTTNTEYTVKKKKPSKYRSTYTRTRVYDGKTYSGSEEAVYRWGKKDGSVAYSYRNKDNVETGRGSDIITLKKGKLAFEWGSNTSYTYYKNGFLKAITSPSYDGKSVVSTEYDSYGYPVKSSSTWSDDDGNGWRTTSYAWAYDAKTKCPTEVVVTTTESDSSTSNSYKWVFSNPMKVKKVRNCDAFGNPVWLGVRLGDDDDDD